MSETMLRPNPGAHDARWWQREMDKAPTQARPSPDIAGVLCWATSGLPVAGKHLAGGQLPTLTKYDIEPYSFTADDLPRGARYIEHGDAVYLVTVDGADRLPDVALYEGDEELGLPFGAVEILTAPCPRCGGGRRVEMIGYTGGSLGAYDVDCSECGD